MGNGRLALVLPTYRFDATAKHCLQTAAGMGGGDVDVFIGDNSGNPEKWDFLRRLASKSENCHLFCHERNIGGPANWRFLLSRTQHEFVCPVSDDDCFTPDFFLAGLDEMKANPDCSAASGLIMFTRHQQTAMEVAIPQSLDQATPSGRIAKFSVWTPSIEYSVHRSDVAFWFQRYVDARPFVLGYTNQFLDYAIICKGKYIINPDRRIFVYDNHNWADEAAGYEYEGKFYAAAGLPSDCAYLQFVFWAADILHFFNSTFRPENLSDEESTKIAETLFDTVFGSLFRFHLVKFAENIGRLFSRAPQCVGHFREIVHTGCQEPQRFLSLFVTILHGFAPDIAARYEAFVRDTTGFKEVGRMDTAFQSIGC